MLCGIKGEVYHSEVILQNTNNGWWSLFWSVFKVFQLGRLNKTYQRTWDSFENTLKPFKCWITSMKYVAVCKGLNDKIYGLFCCGCPPGLAGMIDLILECKREWLTWLIKPQRNVLLELRHRKIRNMKAKVLSAHFW